MAVDTYRSLRAGDTARGQRSAGRQRRFRRLLAPLGVAVLTIGSVGTAVAGPHGGHGRVTIHGRIGPLHIDRSQRTDVVTFAGQPEAEATGSFGDPATPDYDALGYSCRRAFGTGLIRVGRHGPYCRTVYYLNDQTLRLAAFYTSSATFIGPGGMRPGHRAAPPERRTHHWALSGCLSAISFGRRGSRDYLIADVVGGHTKSYPAPHGSSYLRIIGGRIADIQLESGRDPVGLEFC